MSTDTQVARPLGERARTFAQVLEPVDPPALVQLARQPRTDPAEFKPDALVSVSVRVRVRVRLCSHS